MGKSLNENVQELMDRGLLRIAKDNKGNYYCLIADNGNSVRIHSFFENNIKKSFTKLYYYQFKKCSQHRRHRVHWK